MARAGGRQLPTAYPIWNDGKRAKQELKLKLGAHSMVLIVLRCKWVAYEGLPILPPIINNFPSASIHLHSVNFESKHSSSSKPHVLRPSTQIRARPHRTEDLSPWLSVNEVLESLDQGLSTQPLNSPWCEWASGSLLILQPPPRWFAEAGKVRRDGLQTTSSCGRLEPPPITQGRYQELH